jgi:hypothetical protein
MAFNAVDITATVAAICIKPEPFIAWPFFDRYEWRPIPRIRIPRIRRVVDIVEHDTAQTLGAPEGSLTLASVRTTPGRIRRRA